MMEPQQAEIVEMPPERAPVASYEIPEIAAEAETIRVLKRLVTELAPTEWGVPFGGGPDQTDGRKLNQAPARMLAAVLQGRALGIDAMTSLREITVIGGRPYLSAALQLGLVRKAGHSLTGEATPERAVVTGRRADTGEEITFTYSLSDAVAEGLVKLNADGKPTARSSGGRPLPWESYTQSMLWARAVTRLVDRLFSDCTIGAAL